MNRRTSLCIALVAFNLMACCCGAPIPQQSQPPQKAVSKEPEKKVEPLPEPKFENPIQKKTK